MKTNFKIVTLIIGLLLLPIISYFIFIYFFTKEPKPIESYTFSISYNELEKRIKDEIEHEAQANINRDNSFETRYVTLGKDSAKYFFITNLDEDKSRKHKKAWIEFQAVVDSSSKMLDINHDNKDEYSDRVKIFKTEFIDKLRK